MLSRFDEIDLVLPLHEGLHEASRWTTFLQRLRRRTRADGAAIIVMNTRDHADYYLDKPPSFSEMANADAVFDLRRLRELRPARVYGSDEIEGPCAHRRVVRVDRREEGLIAWAMVFRGSEDFAASDGAVLSSLVPHLAAALRSLASLQALEERERIAQDALARLGAGWVAFDREARVIDASALAEQALRHTLAMKRVRGERLHVAAEAGRLLSRAASGELTNRAMVPQIIALAERPRLDLLVASPARANAPMVAFIRLAERSAISPATVSQLFGLSTSEARLAVALADGASIAQAAIDLGLTLETARNYSKRLYAKTGTSGQADLVRLVLTSVAALG